MEPQSDEPDDPLAKSFAGLFDRFWAGEPPELSGSMTGFLIQQLDLGPGARLLCSPRAIVSYACALASRGCMVFGDPPQPGGRRFHGSLWCGTEIGAHDEAVLLPRLTTVAAQVVEGGRLLIDLGRDVTAASSSARIKPLLAAARWEAPVEALAPEGQLFLSAKRCGS